MRRSSVDKGNGLVANFKVGKVFEKSGLTVTLIVIAVLLTIFTKGLFLTPRNIINIVVQSSLTGIVAIGMTLVILTAGIDLSVSGTVILCSIVGAMLMRDGFIWGFVLLIMVSLVFTCFFFTS